MRLWSINPRYLDCIGLVALWREALLAQKVLKGGPPYNVPYGRHPQLQRFKETPEPLRTLRYYLGEVYREARLRNYNFNKKLISPIPRSLDESERPRVTQGQIIYELKFLLKKLRQRDSEKKYWVSRDLAIFIDKSDTDQPFMNRTFTLTQGENTEPWEKVKDI